MTRRRCRSRRREVGSNASQGRGLDFLNNRSYQASTGVFASVDPMVAKTGQPYLYGAANPATKSDPNGLEPRPIHAKPGARTASGEFYKPPKNRNRLYARGCGGYGCTLAPTKILPEGMYNSQKRRREEIADAIAQKANGSDNPNIEIDQLLQALDDARIRSSGSCVLGSVGFAGIGVTGHLCSVSTPDGHGTLASIGGDFGVIAPSVGAGLGVLVSNADSASELRGAQFCFQGSAGVGVGGGASLCGGLTASSAFSGTVTLVTYGQVSVSALPFEASGSLGRSFVWINQGSTSQNRAYHNPDGTCMNGGNAGRCGQGSMNAAGIPN